MPDFNQLFTSAPQQVSTQQEPIADVGAGQLGAYDDEALLELWKDIKIECIDPWPIFERQWHRNILYTLGRQWIEYYASVGWRDKRMAHWVPRPVTNKCKETVQAIRSMFEAIRLSVNVRPNGADPKNISTAATCDELQPILHQRHDMDSVQNEADFWLLVCGNSYFHTYVEYDLKYGTITDPSLSCPTCAQDYKTSETTDSACPTCGGPLEPKLGPDGAPVLNERPKGRPVTTALSPLEITHPNDTARFSALPYVVRRRWRSKRFFENHPVLKLMVPQIAWQKQSSDPSLQLFKNLSRYNDMGIGVLPSYLSGGMSGAPYEEGVTEYEVWMKPCDAYPEGCVFRVIGDKDSPKIVHLEDTEAIPGPLPYKYADGTPAFTFTHTGYEHVGGRILASGPLDVIIQKQDQLNQLDSSVLLTINRMANPVWTIPKGAEPTKITGMPGLIIEWNAMAFGGTAEPKRHEGMGPHQSMFAIREQYLRDIEDLAGTHDILKGQKPAGVEAFSALQLLKEVSQSRFASVFTARGSAYGDWYKFAIELEREFGPDEVTKAVTSPTRRWTFKTFKRAMLDGAVTVVVEDGSNVPKTSLGMRAALDHAAQLGMINLQDPDEQYEGLKLMGLTKMVPGLDIQVQGALQKQEAFEEWAADPMAVQQSLLQTQQATVQYQTILSKMQVTPGMPPPPPPDLNANTPLKWKSWYNALVHRNEFLKWANSDVVRDILTMQPTLEEFLNAHLQQIEQAAMQQAQFQMMMAAGGAPPPVQGAGRGMRNSNQESGGEQNANSPQPA